MKNLIEKMLILIGVKEAPHVHHWECQYTSGTRERGTYTYVCKCECGQWAIREDRSTEYHLVNE